MLKQELIETEYYAHYDESKDIFNGLIELLIQEQLKISNIDKYLLRDMIQRTIDFADNWRKAVFAMAENLDFQLDTTT